MKTIRNASSGITGIRKWSSGLQASITSSGIVTGMVIFFLIICGQKSFSQGVGISEISITPDASSILELRSTLRGLLTPRMTTGQRDAIVTPGTGLIIYNTTTNAFNYYNGSTWIAILNTGTGVTAINGTLNRISVGGTPTVPVIDIDASYAGQGSITTLGTITNGIWNSTRIGLAYGGTNSDLSGSAAIGDLLYANTATTFARLAGVGTGNVLISGGVGTAPLWGKIGLTTHVTGTLPIANGGTGSNTQNFVDLTTAQTIGGAKTFTGAISASNLSGTNTGDQTITLTGDVTGTGTGTFATTISNNAVTYGKIQAVSSTSRLLGSSSTTTPVQEITLGSGLTLTGTTLSSSGLGGTVTNFSSGNLVPLFTTSVATSTTTPTLSFSLSNAAAYTLFGNNTGAAAAPAYFSPLLASALFQNQGATTSVLHGNAAGNPSWGQIINSDISNGTIDLTAKVTGLLPIANGGTGSATAGGARTNLGLGNVENTSLSTWAGSTNITTLGTIGTGTWNATTIGINRGGTGQTTASTAFNALSPITTLGDMIYGSAANTSSRLAGNTSTTPMFLKQTGTGAASAAPVWSTISKIDIGLGNVENTALSTWTGSANITTLGTIGTGTWNGTTIAIANGGTGATTSAGARTNLGLGNVENTALSTWIGSTNITTLGTVGTGTWSGEIITGQYGGTGVANTGKTITLGGNLTTSGAFTTTLTTTANTSLTLPTSGTLATLAGNETLTNKTVNGLSLTSLPNGFSIAGGTVSATLTVPSNATVSGTNTGDQTLAGLGGVPTTRTINGKSLATDIVLGLASADFVNQGTTTTVLHGNAGGSPAFGRTKLTSCLPPETLLICS